MIGRSVSTVYENDKSQLKTGMSKPTNISNVVFFKLLQVINFEKAKNMAMTKMPYEWKLSK